MLTPQTGQPRPTALHLLLHLHDSNQALSLSFHSLLLLCACLNKSHKTTRWAFGFPQSFDPLIFPLRQAIGLHVTPLYVRDSKTNWNLRSLFSPEGFSRLPIISHCVRAWDILIARCARAYITQHFFYHLLWKKFLGCSRFSYTDFKWVKTQGLTSAQNKLAIQMSQTHLKKRKNMGNDELFKCFLVPLILLLTIAHQTHLTGTCKCLSV